MSKKRKSPKSDKADKMLNEASKRLHKEWKKRMPEPMPPREPWSVGKTKAYHEWKNTKWERGYYGSQRWAEELPKRTWYVQTKQQGDPNVRIGFGITFAAIVLIVTKMLFF